MTPDHFNNTNNLFVIFPAGAGGNHLANMLSMHPAFSPRFESTYYESTMRRCYANLLLGRVTDNAHFGVFQNLQDVTFNKFKDSHIKPDTINIWCSHFDEYFFCGETVKRLQNKKYVLFSYPCPGTVAYTRVKKSIYHFGDLRGDEYMYSLQITIDTDLFFSDSSYNYVFDIIEKNTGIELPECCKTMHKFWVKKMKRLWMSKI
jgi:hypothetical protein